MADDTRVPRPRVFISSTITDMADLRDALKFWLEEMGFDVQLSEHNDFERRPDAGTFQACFESITESDYYVLLIGMRRGQWYDERNNITVTRQEFQTAYEAWRKRGKPKILAFVRKEVMTIIRERRAAKASTRTPSRLDDAKLTEEFIHEVRRDDEVKEAVKGTGDFPAANWLTEFGDFRNVTDSLRSALRIRGSLARTAIVENLRHELEYNLRLMMTKHKGQPFFGDSWLASVRREVKVHEDDVKGSVYLTREQIKNIAVYVPLATVPPDSFSRSALDDAILSGALLDYDQQQQTFVPSFILEALYRLREEFGAYEGRYSVVPEAADKWVNLWERVRRNQPEDVAVPAMDLIRVYGLHDSQINLNRLLVAILRHLYGHISELDFKLRPVSPIVGMPERIQEERVSEAELREWLKQDHMYFRTVFSEPDLTEEEQAAHREYWRALRDAVGSEKFEEVMRSAMQNLPEEHVNSLLDAIMALE